MFPLESLCVRKQIHYPFAPEFFAVLLGRIPGELNAPQSISWIKAMVDSLTGAYTAVDLIAFAQGHAMSSLNLKACHDVASLIPLASESQKRCSG